MEPSAPLDMDILGRDIAGLAAMMADGRLTAVELAALCLNRIAAFDRAGPGLNAVPVLNPQALEDAAKLDAERRADRVRGPLHGIPVVVKDSFKVKGLTVAAGSPAFAGLIASDDAASVARLREAGAVILGKTNMPPMAIGGGQRGLYGRTLSPWNPDWLAAAWHSGSSIGSGVAVAAGFAPLALAEETVSSGRSPASNNGLAAYTPSRGVVPIRGNWPLFALRDVVVPYARGTADLALAIRELIRPDPETEGDLWRAQSHVALPGPAAAWPVDPAAPCSGRPLEGKRIGIPRMYAGRDAGLRRPTPLRPSIARLWEETEARLRALGAELADVDFPAVSEYEGDRDGAGTAVSNGYLPADWDAAEIGGLVASGWTEFLRLNGDPDGARLAGTPPAMIHPDPPEAVDTRRRSAAHEGRDAFDYAAICAFAAASPGRPLEEFPQLAGIMQGLERARRELFEDWMAREGLDLVAFPANCDVSRADAEADPASSDQAWTNGTVFSNMNHVMRHLGIPSVSVPMGVMEDTGLPANLTVCGPGWSDHALLAAAAAVEAAAPPLPRPPMAPPLTWIRPAAPPAAAAGPVILRLDAHALLRSDGSVLVEGRATARQGDAALRPVLRLDGHEIAVEADGTFRTVLSRGDRSGRFRALLLVLARGAGGAAAAELADLRFGDAAGPGGA
ncbi:amidase family protein [Mangrovicoccus sp. HB161399]|uniref:amidase family protein n=1 Tax=Mangrovicoccus sp. HB161399 TaxID=2720392 RepID=UPI0015541B00|nr:amidase family protein [Mangrovicoccus sp. HB161399]